MIQHPRNAFTFGFGHQGTAVRAARVSNPSFMRTTSKPCRLSPSPRDRPVVSDGQRTEVLRRSVDATRQTNAEPSR
jgi:hypothetical protein